MNTLIAIIGLGVLCLLFEIFNLRKAIIPMVIIGLLGVLGLTASEFNLTESYYNNMIVVSKFSSAFSCLFIVLTIFLVALGHNFYENHQTKLSDFIAIKVFLLAGAVAMVSFGNLAMFFLGIEVLSIALYILAASNRLNLKSNEAGMKYFLMGSFASGIILFGICLIYGAMGSFDIVEISEMSQSAELPIWFPIGTVLVTIGMLFKVAAVPFHFWAPDVYEGSPTLTTALMSTMAKVVAMATLYKLLSVMNADISEAFKIVVVDYFHGFDDCWKYYGIKTDERETYVSFFRNFTCRFYVDDFIEFIKFSRKFTVLRISLFFIRNRGFQCDFVRL